MKMGELPVRVRLETNVEQVAKVVRAALAVVRDYDTACKASYDECKWEEFNGVESLREALDALANWCKEEGGQ
jgi:hypothetical protein